MTGVFSSSNQNKSKTLEELVGGKDLGEAIAAYTYYLSTKGHVLEAVSEDIPEALPPLKKIIKKLDEFGECKSFLTNDQEALKKCIDEYNFKNSLLGGIWEYTIWKHTPEQIKEFIRGLEALAEGGKRVIKDLYKQYQQYKTTSIPQEDVDPRVLEIIPEARAIESLILRYLENPDGYGKQLSKYLGKKLLEARVEERKEVKADKELKEAAENYTLYADYMRDALDIVSEHIPQALPSLATLIENLREWDKGNLLTNNQEALKKYADKYYFMAYFMGSILEWWVSKWKIPPEEIEGFTKGLETLAKGGKEIIDGLYRLYKEVNKLALEDISKIYKTINIYRLKEARASAAGTIEYFLVNYFRNPEEHKDQLMKYAGMKPLGWLDRAICNLYGGCKTEKQNK
jgi:DNA repair exonuclease SbcCD ATPase subunit